MDIETCKKYIRFVHKECEKHLEDGKVMDDELYKLIIEFTRFKEKVSESELPDELKDKISSVDFKYTRKGVNRSRGYLILAVITLGIWALIIWMLRQQRRNRTLENIKHDMNSLGMWIDMHY
ncbi:MAG: hypothetical protein WBM43_10820 [Flavobacteriaceae bacterium]